MLFSSLTMHACVCSIFQFNKGQLPQKTSQFITPSCLPLLTWLYGLKSKSSFKEFFNGVHFSTYILGIVNICCMARVRRCTEKVITRREDSVLPRIFLVLQGGIALSHDNDCSQCKLLLSQMNKESAHE